MDFWIRATRSESEREREREREGAIGNSRPLECTIHGLLGVGKLAETIAAKESVAYVEKRGRPSHVRERAFEREGSLPAQTVRSA